MDEDINVETIRESRGGRWLRSLTARLRRQHSKAAKQSHQLKDEQDALQRLEAKKLLESQKKSKKTVELESKNS